MITTLTSRFILISMIFAVFAVGIAFMVGKESRHDRSWVAAQPVPCSTTHDMPCRLPAKSVQGRTP